MAQQLPGFVHALMAQAGVQPFPQVLPQAIPAQPPAAPAQNSISSIIKNLQERQMVYCERAELRPGDIVRWKQHMWNRRYPARDDVAVVTRVYASAVYDVERQDTSSPLYYEPLDVALGVFDNEGDFVEFHYDSRRFTHAEADSAAPRLVQRLTECYARLTEGQRPGDKYDEAADLHPGDYVMWKPGLKNKKRPAANQAGVVVGVLPHPIYDQKKSSGSQYFMEPLDIKIGMLDDDGEFIVFHYDSRRFQVVPT
eukprot:m51a1_g6869 hypothetical protein (254) ;mRNA; f:164582-165894